MDSDQHYTMSSPEKCRETCVDNVTVECLLSSIAVHNMSTELHDAAIKYVEGHKTSAPSTEATLDANKSPDSQRGAGTQLLYNSPKTVGDSTHSGSGGIIPSLPANIAANQPHILLSHVDTGALSAVGHKENVNPCSNVTVFPPVKGSAPTVPCDRYAPSALLESAGGTHLVDRKIRHASHPSDNKFHGTEPTLNSGLSDVHGLSDHLNRSSIHGGAFKQQSNSDKINSIIPKNKALSAPSAGVGSDLSQQDQQRKGTHVIHPVHINIGNTGDREGLGKIPPRVTAKIPRAFLNHLENLPSVHFGITGSRLRVMTDAPKPMGTKEAPAGQQRKSNRRGARTKPTKPQFSSDEEIADHPPLPRRTLDKYYNPRDNKKPPLGIHCIVFLARPKNPSVTRVFQWRHGQDGKRQETTFNPINSPPVCLSPFKGGPRITVVGPRAPTVLRIPIRGVMRVDKRWNRPRPPNRVNPSQEGTWDGP